MKPFHFETRVHLYYSFSISKLVYNPYLRTKMMNCSSTIDINLGYKTYRILVQPRHLEVLKYFFLTIFIILVTPSFSLDYYYVYNFENHF